MNKVCPFCNLEASRVILENDLAIAICDGYPVSRGHVLVIPKRHVGSFFEITETERQAMLSLLDRFQKKLLEEFGPDAFNIGINDGAAAGQTVPHLHIHLIPRYEGDQVDPRGGVRLIFPDKAKYWDE